MKQILEPIACIASVRAAALITIDGVPICVYNAPSRSNGAQPSAKRNDANEPAESTESDGVDEAQALAALAASWVSEVARAAAPLSWPEPQRFVLRAARGTLVITQAPGALLVVVLQGGALSEELRLPMEIVVSRLQRHLRSTRSDSPLQSATDFAPQPNLQAQVDAPIGALPKQTSTRAGEGNPAAGVIASHRTGIAPASHPTSSGE